MNVFIWAFERHLLNTSHRWWHYCVSPRLDY